MWNRGYWTMFILQGYDLYDTVFHVLVKITPDCWERLIRPNLNRLIVIVTLT